MKRYLVTFAVLLVAATVSCAWETDVLDTDKAGRLNVHGAAGGFLIDGTAVSSTAAELNKMDGVTATADEINAAADLSARMTTVSVTNGQAVTLSASTPIIMVTGTGSANNATNTVTLSLPYPVGQEFIFVVASASSNLISIADSTTVVALGSNWVGDNTDTLKILTTGTNTAVKISAEDN